MLWICLKQDWTGNVALENLAVLAECQLALSDDYHVVIEGSVPQAWGVSQHPRMKHSLAFHWCSCWLR